MNWTDTLDIALALDAAHPDIDPQWLRFTDLHAWVLALPDFIGEADKSNEKILEAIQMAWIDERS